MDPMLAWLIQQNQKQQFMVRWHQELVLNLLLCTVAKEVPLAFDSVHKENERVHLVNR
jgi:hypothetical protein